MKEYINDEDFQKKVGGGEDFEFYVLSREEIEKLGISPKSLRNRNVDRCDYTIIKTVRDLLRECAERGIEISVSKSTKRKDEEEQVEYDLMINTDLLYDFDKYKFLSYNSGSLELEEKNPVDLEWVAYYIEVKDMCESFKYSEDIDESKENIIFLLDCLYIEQAECDLGFEEEKIILDITN